MTITAQVIADSIADGCPRLTTLQLRYPRFIHAEARTHRIISMETQGIFEVGPDAGFMECGDLSRNASSSRAIPIERVIQDVVDDTAMPIYWGANQRGMQAGAELPSGEDEWLAARDCAIYSARLLAKRGYHKQIVNRILEPFQHINVLVTATDWDNFFSLRDHPDAQPEMQRLAQVMREAMAGSVPDYMSDNEWHTPYITADDCFETEHEFNDGRTQSGEMIRRISAARCASVSYKTVDGKPMTVDRALSIFDSLTGDPLHASPFEHIARPDPNNGPGCRNFTGWHQWRSDLEGAV